MTTTDDLAPREEAAAAAWHPDPLGRFETRYWDGAAWTADVASAGSQLVDPLGTTPSPSVPSTLPQPIGRWGSLPCMFCARIPAAQVTFHQGIGMLILHQHKYVKGLMCRECGAPAYKSLQKRTLITGWWGILSFPVNIIYILMNLSGAAKLKKLPAPQ